MKSSPGVAVFYQPLAVVQAQFARQLHRGRTRGVRHGNHAVNLQVRMRIPNGPRQPPPHVQPGLVNQHILHNCVRTGEVNVFKNARRAARAVGALSAAHFAVGGNKDRLARRQVAHVLKAQRAQRHAFGRDHPLVGSAPAQRQRRIPRGSRNASIPSPAISATTA